MRKCWRPPHFSLVETLVRTLLDIFNFVLKATHVWEGDGVSWINQFRLSPVVTPRRGVVVGDANFYYERWRFFHRSYFPNRSPITQLHAARRAVSAAFLHSQTAVHLHCESVVAWLSTERPKGSVKHFDAEVKQRTHQFAKHTCAAQRTAWAHHETPPQKKI